MEAGVEALISECAGNANVLVEVNSTVGKLPKLSSLLELCSPKTVSSLLFACPGVILSDFSEWRFHPLPPPSNIDHHHVSSFHHVCHQITPPSRIGQSREKGICDYNVPAASSGFCKKKGSTLAQGHMIVHIHPQGIKKILTYSVSAIFAVGSSRSLFEQTLEKRKEYGLSGRRVAERTVVGLSVCFCAPSLEVGWRARLSDPPRSGALMN